jgi:hypothetical protein
LFSPSPPPTASVDNTVLYHPFNSKTPIPIPHPYYVKSLRLLPPTFHSTPLLLTGSTDESIRVFDISPILEGILTTCNSNSTTTTAAAAAAASLPSAKERKSIEGHCHEVSALDTWIKTGISGKEAWVVSAGLDGTIRRWSMEGEPGGGGGELLMRLCRLLTHAHTPPHARSDVLHPKDLPEDVEDDEEAKEGNGLTEEEERELAEMMDDE